MNYKSDLLRGAITYLGITRFYSKSGGPWPEWLAKDGLPLGGVFFLFIGNWPAYLLRDTGVMSCMYVQYDG